MTTIAQLCPHCGAELYDRVYWPGLCGSCLGDVAEREDDTMLDAYCVHCWRSVLRAMQYQGCTDEHAEHEYEVFTSRAELVRRLRDVWAKWKASE